MSISNYLVVAVVFYFSEMRRWFGRAAKPLLFSMMSVVAMLGVLVVSGYGVSRESAGKLDPLNKPKPKNILILASDSLRADHLSCNGYHRPTSPSIDQFGCLGWRLSAVFTGSL